MPQQQNRSNVFHVTGNRILEQHTTQNEHGASCIDSFQNEQEKVTDVLLSANEEKHSTFVSSC
jgi:hypothetical protein